MLVPAYYNKKSLVDFTGLLQQRKTITSQLSLSYWVVQHLSGSLFEQSHCLCSENRDGTACWALRLAGPAGGAPCLSGALG